MRGIRAGAGTRAHNLVKTKPVCYRRRRAQHGRNATQSGDRFQWTAQHSAKWLYGSMAIPVLETKPGMRIAKQERKLPSCRVDKSLLEEIERYMLAFPEAGGDFEVTVDDDLGTETFHSSSELRDRFSDSVKAVALHRCRFFDIGGKTTGGKFSLGVLFDRDGYFSRIKAETAGDQARERLDGFMNGILRIVEPRRTYSGLFHPGLMYQGAFFLLGLVVVMLAAGSFGPLVPPWYSAILVAAALLFITYMIGAWLKPYTAFLSRRVESREKVWIWLASGLAAFTLFSTVLAALRRKLLGY
jgi:hypothetical protein